MSPIALSNIPATARDAERRARAQATDNSGYEIVVRPGCHGRPPSDPPVVGYVESLTAARALAAELTRMPDGSQHRRLSYRPFGEFGPGCWPDHDGSTPVKEKTS